jgi:hypothetical protein
MKIIGHPSPLHERYGHTKEKIILKVFRDGTCKFTWNGNKIPHIGRYGGHKWQKQGLRIMDAQAVFPLSTR